MENTEQGRHMEEPASERTGDAASVELGATRDRIEHLYRVLRAISNVNQLIVRERDRDRLIQSACNLLIETRGYYHAWIAATSHDAELIAYAQAGMGDHFSLLFEQWKRGELTHCVRRALAQPGVITTSDPAMACADCSLAKDCVGRVAMTVRLEQGGMVHGLLCASIPAQLVEDEEEQALLLEVAGDIALALHDIELEAARQQAEASLQKSLLSLRQAEDMARLGYFERNWQTGAGFWSDGLYRLLGHEPGEVSCDHDAFLTYLHPDDREQVVRHIGETLATHQPMSIEFRLVQKGGAVILVQGVGQNMYDQDGRPLLTRGTFQDITERKQVEGELRESQANLSALIENNDGLIWSVDRGYRLIVGNVAFDRVISAGRGRPFAPGENVLPAKSAQEVLEEWRGYYDRALDGESFAVETPRRFTDTPGYMEYRFSPILAADGSAAGATVFGRDITERRRMQDALRESEAQKALILNAATEMVNYYDRDLRVIWANRAACESVGKEPDELVGLHCYEIWQQRDAPCPDCPVLKARDNGVPWQDEQQTPDGRYWSLRGYPVFDDQHQVIAMVEFGQDITTRKQAEAEQERLRAQLMQAAKMESVGRLAGGVAHDFNNMLQAIMGNAYLALEQVETEGSLHESLREIAHAAERSAGLTRQLLAFARKQVIVPVQLDLNDAVVGMLKMLRRLIGEEIDLAWKPGAELWQVRMDPSQLDQILANLCVNARDAIAGVGQLTLETKNVVIRPQDVAADPDATPGAYVLLAVSDDGRGMEQAVLDHLFEPFFTTKDVGEGTGLGLATVYGIVRQNEGFIRVRSQVGQGTVFSIYLPRFDAPAVAPHAERMAASQQSQDEMVLLVEDEPAVLRLSERLLRRLGYEVMHAATPGEAIKLATATPPGEIHLLITDVVMPQMSGRVLMERVRAMHPDIRCLFMSGYTADIIAERGVLDKDLHFLQKPFTPSDLAAKVREALG